VQPVKSLYQHLSVNEYLDGIPGLFAMNSQNYAQDLRISIRGFGSRAAFGIRGIKLIVDGIPETTPDGQGQIDNLLVSAIQRLEVLRGPSASLYGNASGGVISISTLDPFPGTTAELSTSIGAYGRFLVGGHYGRRSVNTKFVLRGTHLISDGYRLSSGTKSTILGGAVEQKLNENATVRILFNYTDSPQADDPGGLNADEVEADRTAARDRNVMFQAGEEVKHWKTGFKLDWSLGNNMEFDFYGFYSSRDFDGRLPFGFGGIVDLSRTYWGTGLQVSKKWTGKRLVNTIMAGFDIGDQEDIRRRYQNLNGVRGEATLDQVESFFNAGFYMLNRLSVGNWTFNGGVRLDVNDLSLEDRFLSNEDDSGEMNLNNVNPSLGLAYRFSRSHTLFTNFSTSFETPTLSELSGDPSGAAGFNPNIKAQEGKSFEIGLRGRFQRDFRYEIVGFTIATENELVPYEDPVLQGREFFRNAGKTRRTGVEITTSYTISDHFLLSTSYSYASIEYREYPLGQVDLAGNRIPGIPKQMGSIMLDYNPGDGFFGRITTRFVGDMYAEDLNQTLVDKFSVVNLKIGHRIVLQGMVILPHVGVNNLFNTKYFDNIRINAFGGRFYEPAPEVNMYGGIRIQFGK
jgi:iron complex outermembrane receptor protein